MIDMRYHFKLTVTQDWMEVRIPSMGFVPRVGDLVNHTVTLGDSIISIERRVKDVEVTTAEFSTNVNVLVILEDELCATQHNNDCL